MHFDFGVADCVLFASGRNYSADVTCDSIAGQIFVIHYDFDFPVGLDHCVCFEHLFQVRNFRKLGDDGLVRRIF